MHWADKVALKVRAPLIAGLILIVPVGLLGYGYMAALAVQMWPWWVAWPVILGQLVMFVAVASLIDSRQPPSPPTQDDQS